ncbi:hypothetical protein Rhopal_001537-T1 [Rhodotorula paludigena]|uniref:CUE domain-containing protein n=1 Tax=Rhodotorula paludigena TaxID=86838 RepID=A0AAV5GG27_9BASI|nr:hypothetical protein Rhopal_001537-T1 [Rhodotorula paludigena]
MSSPSEADKVDKPTEAAPPVETPKEVEDDASPPSPPKPDDDERPPATLVVAPEPAAEQAPPAQEQVRDPKVAQLKALFPGTEDAIVEAVLDAVGGSLDEATEQLLVMNDPTFKPDAAELSQLEADEELARQFAREDEVAQAQQRVNAPRRSASLPQAQPQEPRPLAYQPYVPKSRRTTGAGGPASPSLSSWQPPAQQQSQQQRSQEGQPARERDELDQLTEQFSRFADQGKKTLGGFFSRVKEQVARVDEAIIRSASPPQRDDAVPPPPPPKPAAPAPGPSSPSAWTTPSALPRPADAPPRSSSPMSTARPSSPFHPSDVLTRSESHTSAHSGSSKDAATAGKAPPPSSVSTTESPKKDLAGKIPGLLPRQSFSLLDANGKPAPGGLKSPGESPAAGTGAAGASVVVKSPLSAPHHALGDDDSDSDLEYTKSPFDED